MSGVAGSRLASRPRSTESGIAVGISGKSLMVNSRGRPGFSYANPTSRAISLLYWVFPPASSASLTQRCSGRRRAALGGSSPTRRMLRAPRSDFGRRYRQTSVATPGTSPAPMSLALAPRDILKPARISDCPVQSGHIAERCANRDGLSLRTPGSRPPPSRTSEMALRPSGSASFRQRRVSTAIGNNAVFPKRWRSEKTSGCSCFRRFWVFESGSGFLPLGRVN